jgi:hypothetical protein
MMAAQIAKSMLDINALIPLAHLLVEMVLSKTNTRRIL